MTVNPLDNPYRVPEADGDESKTPGLFTLLMILTGAVSAGGLTFLVTCFGSAISLGAILDTVTSHGRGGSIGGLTVFIFSVAVSGYVAWRTGHAIRRLFSDAADDSRV